MNAINAKAKKFDGFGGRSMTCINYLT